MKKNLNNICKCGHDADEHGISLNLGSYCDMCWNNKNLSRKEVYHNYKQDNLKYLENLYDKRIKK
jgi:hypothetical protein